MDRQSPVNGLNQHTASGASSLSYDARGNLTNNGSVTFGYDIDNRLTSSSSGATIAYDALDRISQVTNASGTVTKFLYDGDDLIAEYDGSGVMQHRYVHGPGVDEPLVSYPGSGTAAKNYLVADQEGSIIAQTDIAGQWQSTDTYDEYGNPGSTNTGRFQYTGQVWLPEFGVYSYKARDYAPGLGVFLQTDPIGYAGGMNLYAYVGGDPVNLTDAFGLCEGQGTRTPCVPHRVSGVEVDGKRPPPPPDCPTSVDHCVTGPLKGIPTRVQFQPGALRPPRPGSGTRPSKDKKRKAACDAAGYADRLGSGYENIAVGFAGLAEVAGGDSAGPQAAATAPAAVFFSAVAGAYGGGATLAHLFAAGARFYATGNAAQVITTLVGLGVEKASGVKGLSEAADSKADSVISDFITGDPCKDHK